jgi:hypothetical protein
MNRTRLKFNRNLDGRFYGNREFYGCALKLRHLDYWSAMCHASSLKAAKPLANIHIYGCDYCGGLHVTSGDKRYNDSTQLQNSLAHLQKMMAHPNYALKVPQEIQARDAQLIVDIQARLIELEG